MKSTPADRVSENQNIDRGGYTLQIISSIQEFERIAEPWNDLVSRCPSATIFQNYEWIYACCQWVETKGKLFIITVWEKEILVGAAPLVLHVHFFWGRIFRFIGNNISDYQMILTDSSKNSQEIFSTILNAITKYKNLWDMVELRDIPDFDQNLAFLIEGEHGLQTKNMVIMHDSLSCRIELPETWEAYLSELSHNMKTTLEKTNRRLKKEHLFQIKDLANPDEWEEGMQKLFELHQGRWSRTTNRGAFSQDNIKNLHRTVVKLLINTGKVHLYAIFVENEPIAISYLFEVNRTFYAYLSGRSIDENYEKYSLGSQLKRETIKIAIETGMSTFDLLRGEEAYKLRFGSKTYFNTDVIFFKTRIGLLKHKIQLFYRQTRSRVPDSLKTRLKRFFRKITP